MPDTESDLFDVLLSAPVGAIILDDRDHQVLFWNAAVLSVLGTMEGETFAAAAKSGFFYNRQDFIAARDQLATTGSLLAHETRVARTDGQEVWAEVTMRPLRFENNDATLIWYADITDAKRREHQLERSQDSLLDVLEAAPTGAALTDGPERISYWNSALLKIFPGEAEDSSDKIHAGVRLAHSAIDRQGQGATIVFAAADGSERFVTGWKFRVAFEGAASELLWLHEITELRRAQSAAQAATAAKSAFLATMSHEIRTPMNGVMTIAELLAETPLSADQAGMVGIIRQSGESLIRVVNDILDFSKLESSQLQVETIPFALEEAVTGVQQLLAPKAAEKGLALHLRQQGSDAVARTGDPLRLRQVLLNLVGNAIKFTERGSVTLDLDATLDRVVFKVVDTGIGIPPEKIAKLFHPYQQADKATARNYGGTGLGLSICNALLTLMGSSLTVDSTPGAGSCFSFAIDLPRDATVAPLARAGLAAASGKWGKPDRTEAERTAAVILCAEDNPTNRDVLARVLNRLGFAHDMVNDGAEALQALDRSRHGLILTDGHMPNVDGWELVERLRSDEAAAGLPRMPVVMVTADAVSEMGGPPPGSELDASLTKPLRRDRLEATLLAVLPVLGSLRRPLDDTAIAVVPPAAALDLAGLAELVGDARDDLAAVLADFQAGAFAQRDRLCRAFAASDRAGVISAAHALKGAAGNAGARAISERAASLEAAAKAGAGLETLADGIDGLAAMVSRLPGDIASSLAAYPA